MEETLEQLSESIEDVQKKFYGVVTGKVINLADPLTLGRVQVQLPFIDSADLSPWARVAVPMAGIAHGTYFIPDIGQEVLVAFEHGELDAPYIIGSLWNAMTPPPLPSPLAQIRMISTLAGNRITFTEIPPTITIMTPSGQTIAMTPAGIQITSGSNLINMTPDGITMSGPMVNIAATGAINLKAPNINVVSDAATNINGGGACNILAGLVKIN